MNTVISTYYIPILDGVQDFTDVMMSVEHFYPNSSNLDFFDSYHGGKTYEKPDIN
jgi:hypothetical protein